jgi:hypothetical protein
MKLLRQFQYYLRIAAVVAAAYVGWVFTHRYFEHRAWTQQRELKQAGSNPEFESVYGGTAVKILQFYAREGSLTEGGTTVICYGLLNAKTVRIQPPVEGVSVSLNRCATIAPERDTKYTLTAEGSDGRTVSESLVVTVKPDLSMLPKITSFGITGHKLERGQHIFSLSFAVQNAETVEIDPPVFPALHGAPFGHFYVAPRETATYTLTATGRKGRTVRRKLTVQVPPT